MRPTINSEKHMINHSLTTTTIGNIANVQLIESVTVLNKNQANEVEEGSTVKAIFCELWVTSDASTLGTVNVTVEKVPASATPMTNAQAANLTAYPNKKNIFYTAQGLSNPNVGAGAIPMLKQLVLIPKGKQRMGLGDKVFCNISGQAGGVLSCGMFIFKEYK